MGERIFMVDKELAAVLGVPLAALSRAARAGENRRTMSPRLASVLATTQPIIIGACRRWRIVGVAAALGMSAADLRAQI